MLKITTNKVFFKKKVRKIEIENIDVFNWSLKGPLASKQLILSSAQILIPTMRSQPMPSLI